MSSKENKTIPVGVISDTHGLLRPEVFDVFSGVERIIHAGDIGKPDIIRELENIAPVTAVRGNMDYYEWSRQYPDKDIFEIGEISIYLLHNAFMIDLDPLSAGIQLVVHGHTHHPSLEKRGGVLFLNPGSAGPKRSGHPISVAVIDVQGKTIRHRFIELDNR